MWGCQACLLRSLLRIGDHLTGLALGAVQAGEGVPGRYSRLQEMQMVSVRLQQALFWFLGEHAPRLCEAVRWIGPSPGGVAGGSTNPEVDILLRLQHAATFSSWQVRATCVEALGKVSLRSIASEDDEQAELALSIYEFLSATNADDNLGLQLVTAPIVQIMDLCYAAREWLLVKLTGGAVGGGSDGRDLGEEIRLKHSKLLQQVSLFCDVAGMPGGCKYTRNPHHNLITGSGSGSGSSSGSGSGSISD